MNGQVDWTGADGLGSLGVRQRVIDISPQNWVKVAVALAGQHLDPTTTDPVKPVCEALGCSKQTVYNWIKAGTMKHVAYDQTKRLSVLSHVPIDWLTP